jgi:RNA polymerase sigma factor (sigma-70 family)
LTGREAAEDNPIVAKFRIEALAELTRQMAEFTPHDVRVTQVAAAEELLHSLEAIKAYPLEFIVYRITGYRPKGAVSPDAELLTGLALQHDLGLLIEQVSETLDVRTDALAEPVLDIEAVCERFNVTSKTIQRWRRKGLPARRFVFGDGKRRVGFLLSSVERFFSEHRDQVARGMNFSQLTDAERGEILARARRLAVYCQCCTHEVARRVARKMNRSPLTILHTIRKHDQEKPAEAVFPLAAEPVSEEERTKILKGYRRGVPLAALARRVCRPRSAVYRVVVDERIARLNRRKVKFIDDPLYHQEGAGEAVGSIVEGAEASLGSEGKAEEARVPKDLPAYLQALYRTPLLTPARERALFLAFNYQKYRFVTARRRLEPQFARTREVNALEAHLRRATEVKNQIVQANLRLVVSVARKHLRPGLSLMELVSDGNVTLMRAVESYDFHRGHRFSTYATLALMKGFARSVPQLLSTGRVRTSGGDRALAEVCDVRPDVSHDRLLAREEVQQLLARLDDRERAVVLTHYGIETGGTDPARRAPATYEQVARLLGLTKQRVRQIEQSALAKLRSAAADPVADRAAARL